MKYGRMLMVCALLIALLSLLSCGKADKSDVTDENTDFRETSEGFFLPCENDCYIVVIQKEGPVEMSLADGDYSIFDSLAIGDKIRVVHGYFEETYPASTRVYSVEKLSSGTIDNISSDIIENLESLGRKIKVAR